MTDEIYTIASAFGIISEEAGVYNCWCPVCGYKCLSVFRAEDGRPDFLCWSCRDKAAIRREVEARGLVRGERPPKVARAEQLKDATTLWTAGAPIGGTLAAAYMARRGLMDPYPDALRYLDVDAAGALGGDFYHGLIARVERAGARRTFLGCHFTSLTLGGRKIHGGKSIYRRFGLLSGGGVWFGEPGGDGELVVGEGIETTLSAMRLFGAGWGVAALGAANFSRLVLPATAWRVLLAADNDVNGDGQLATAVAESLWLGEGRKVRVETPPEPGTDWNDVLRKVYSSNPTAKLSALLRNGIA
ncbi:toprim domain-containing protein [Rhodoblastus sp.]|uniref:toprim domain-containing protein n=1 Tax=Rhodoblastus sp. TaxID=1962975 RepID=UPI0025DF30E9|nr:toprim domain-containing protein [Rhodoblastus sp.]